MALPRYTAFVDPVLRFLDAVGGPVAANQVYVSIADAMGLSVGDRQLPLKSGGFVYTNRIGWAFNWLKRAGLGHAAVPGEWQLTAAGKEFAAANPKMTAELMVAFNGRVMARSSSEKNAPIHASEERSPLESRPSKEGKKAYRRPARPLTSGGQADIYEAVRKRDNKKVIYKRSLALVGNRMKREIEVQSALEHPHIMPILDWDGDSFSWYVMPKASRALSDVPRPLAFDLTYEVLQSVMAALSCAHAAGYPHRDIKPQNILELVDENGNSRWVLADWGLTRRQLGQTTTPLTRSGQLLGSEGFAPPEAYSDAHNVGAPGDIYALGQLVAWTTGVDPVPNLSPKVAEPWSGFVERLTQQEADKRPQKIADVVSMLSELSTSLRR